MSLPEPASESGFTLIESIVAALILVLAFTALAVVFDNGQSQASADVQESQLINLGDQQLEFIRGAVQSEGFDDLALSAVPTVPSGVAVQSTWANPTTFVETGTSPCGAASGGAYYDFEIASNYDSVNTALSGGPYGTSPSKFVPWSGCNQSEPLEVISSATPAALITVGGTPGTCGATTITSPCQETEGGQTFNVYTFVTDTYIGCSGGTSGSGASVVCPSGTTSTQPISNTNPVNTATCTFPTTTTASTPCADARRVIVAVVPSTEVGQTVKAALSRITPVYVSSIFTNPTPSTSAQSSVGLTLETGI